MLTAIQCPDMNQGGVFGGLHGFRGWRSIQHAGDDAGDLRYRGTNMLAYRDEVAAMPCFPSLQGEA